MRFAVILCFFVLFTACGGDKHADRKEIAFLHRGTPLLYKIADPECTAEKALKELGLTKVWVAQSGKIKLLEFDFSDVSGDGLHSKFVHEAIVDYALEFEYHCPVDASNQPHCQTPKVKIQAPGRRLYFCRKGGNYPRESLENVALASLVGVRNAHQWHTSVLDSTSLGSLNLLIHPQIIHHKVIDNTVSTGAVSLDIHDTRVNDARFLTVGNSKYIAVYPEGLDASSKSLKSESRFWEIPAVLSHEYGHFILEHYAPKLLSTLGVDVGIEGLDLVRLAIDEAFADLVSYFTYAKDRSIVGAYSLDGAFDHRKVSRQHFSDGTAKRLDAWFLQHYFAQTSTLDLRKHEPDPTNHHAIGTVLAHGIFKWIEIDSSGVEDSYRRVIQWSQNLEAKFQNLHQQHNLDANAFFEYLVGASLDLQFLSSSSHVTQKHCKVLREIFPIWERLLHDSCKAWED